MMSFIRTLLRNEQMIKGLILTFESGLIYYQSGIINLTGNLKMRSARRSHFCHAGPKYQNRGAKMFLTITLVCPIYCTSAVHLLTGVSLAAGCGVAGWYSAPSGPALLAGQLGGSPLSAECRSLPQRLPRPMWRTRRPSVRRGRTCP